LSAWCGDGLKRTLGSFQRPAKVMIVFLIISVASSSVLPFTFSALALLPWCGADLLASILSFTLLRPFEGFAPS
jgi:hypothetical protein